MRRLVVAAALAIVPVLALAQGTETAGMITEIKVGRGRVEIRPAAGGDWRRAGPLQALRAGDAVRASHDAVAVVLLSGGGTVKVAAGNSPYTVAARADETRGQKARALVQAGLGFLAAGQREAPAAALATRGVARPPLVISPRNTAVLPEPLALEWVGSRFARYTVRVTAPAGVVLERRGVTGGRLEYPPDAPALAPGTRYTVQVTAAGQPAQEAWFEVVDATRARAVREDLAALQQGLGAGASPSSVAVLRAGFLASAGLLHDARRAALAALAADPDEPGLHQLLGTLYDRGGLAELAADAWDEAQFLLTRDAR